MDASHFSHWSIFLLFLSSKLCTRPSRTRSFFVLQRIIEIWYIWGVNRLGMCTIFSFKTPFSILSFTTFSDSKTKDIFHQLEATPFNIWQQYEIANASLRKLLIIWNSNMSVQWYKFIYLLITVVTGCEYGDRQPSFCAKQQNISETWCDHYSDYCCKTCSHSGTAQISAGVYSFIFFIAMLIIIWH